MELRTTSAGYRLPPKRNPTRNVAVQSTRPDLSKQHGESLVYNIGGQKCDAVAFDKILTDRIKQEWSAAKKWNTYWSFMAEYNPKGELKQPKKFPTEENYYNNNIIPITAGAAYGSRQRSDSAQAIIKYQLDMTKPFRKRQIGAEFQCY